MNESNSIEVEVANTCLGVRLLLSGEIPYQFITFCGVGFWGDTSKLTKEFMTWKSSEYRI